MAKKQASTALMKSNGTAAALSDPKQFKAALQNEAKIRKLVQQFIKKQLIDGVDYGKIHVSKNCTNKPWEQNKCPPGHFSKNTLFKPGAEKFCSLLQLIPKFESDVDIIKMIPQSIMDDAGVIALKCNLVNSNTGKIMATGKGACTIKEKFGQVNTAIKIAEKRAQVDAVLRLGFSDTFTQDIEDLPQEETQVKTSPDEIKKQQSDLRKECNDLVIKHKIELSKEEAKIITDKNTSVDSLFVMVQKLNGYAQKKLNDKKHSKEEKEIREYISDANKVLGYTKKKMEEFISGMYPAKKTWDNLTIEDKRKVMNVIMDMAMDKEQKNAKKKK